jgi:hypothetical protein
MLGKWMVTYEDITAFEDKVGSPVVPHLDIEPE